MIPGPLPSAGLSRKPILILGLGNPLRGDDGVGCQVAEALARQTLPPDVEVMDVGTPGVGLLHLLEGRRRVILVDAAEMGRTPGSVARFRPDEVRLGESAEGFSLHHSGMAEALALAEALRLDLPELVVFGVQPAHIGWDQELSCPVQAAVASVVEAVSQEAGGSPPREQIMAHEKLLIIDDDDDIVLAMRLPLEAAGYQVFRAAASTEGLQKVKEVHPDLILLDVMMDTTTAGIQVCLTLRNPDPASEYATFREVPILMITAIHATTPLRFAPDHEYLPVDAFIEKPIEPDALLARVREQLAKKPA